MAFPPAKKPAPAPKKPKNPLDDESESTSDEFPVPPLVTEDEAVEPTPEEPKAEDDEEDLAKQAPKTMGLPEDEDDESSSDVPPSKMKGAKPNPLRKWAASMDDAATAGLLRPKPRM